MEYDKIDDYVRISFISPANCKLVCFYDLKRQMIAPSSVFFSFVEFLCPNSSVFKFKLIIAGNHNSSVSKLLLINPAGQFFTFHISNISFSGVPKGISGSGQKNDNSC